VAAGEIGEVDAAARGGRLGAPFAQPALRSRVVGPGEEDLR